MNGPTLINPALDLLRALDDGALFTPWAEHRCGQEIHADAELINPPYLFGWEAGTLRVGARDTYAALRRTGCLVQADGTKVAKVGSVVPRAHVTAETFRVLQTTATPVGTALAAQAAGQGVPISSITMWSSAGTDEYAVHCVRLVMVGGVPAAIATDRVLWSWLALPPC